MNNFDFKGNAALNAANNGVNSNRISQLNSAASLNNAAVGKNYKILKKY